MAAAHRAPVKKSENAPGLSRGSLRFSLQTNTGHRGDATGLPGGVSRSGNVGNTPLSGAVQNREPSGNSQPTPPSGTALESHATARTAFACCVWLLAAVPLVAAEPAVRIAAREPWSAVFGDTQVEFHFDLSSDRAFDGRIAWALRADRRTLFRGETPVTSPDQPATVAIPLRIPPVKEGLVFGTELEVSVYEDRGPKPAASLVKPLWIYARDPFVDRSQWLTDLKLVLYDPVGKTAAVLDQTHIPYRELRNPAALAELPEGLLVIGEGLSLADHRTVADAICQTAAGGVPVLCLAPVDGSFDLPGGTTAAGNDAGQTAGASSHATARPHSLTFRRADVLADLDHRFDDQGWPPDGKLMARSLALTSEAGRVVAQVIASPDGWPWLQVRYPPPGAVLIVCQFTLIEHCDAGPTPRFLLARLLEYLTNPQTPISQ
jgi:hypothetical protein